MALAILAISALGLTAAVVLVGPDRAGAATPPIPFGLYLHRVDGQSADPVNLIFAGDDDPTAVALQLVKVLHWVPVAGSDMTFTDHGVLLWSDTQLGMTMPGGLRHHIRLAGGEESSERWGAYTLAGVHRDLDVSCGHVGTDFDGERDAVARAMENAGYRVTWLWLGNAGAVTHCDGTVNHGDGWAAVIELPQRTSASPAPSATPVATAAPSPSAAPSASPTPAPTATPTPTPTPAPTPDPPREPASLLARSGR